MIIKLTPHLIHNMDSNFLLALIIFQLFAIVSVLLIPILCLFEVFTQVLAIYLSIRHKQWIKLVDNFDTVFLLRKENPHLVSTFFLIFRGSLDLEEIKNTVKHKWTNVKDKNQYKHPHLRQHTVDSCGYFYWLQDKNFSIDDHVRLYDCKPPKNQTELDDLCSKMCSEPLSETKSPWLILLVPLDESFGNEPRYVIFLRFQHCMGDGYNVTRMINHCFLDEKCVKYLPPKAEKRFSTSALLIGLLYYPKYVVDSYRSRDNNVLHGPTQCAKRFLRPLTLSSLTRVKKVAKATGATINDVMVSCIAGALKKFFSKCNATPSHLHCACSISMQSISEEVVFRNNFSGFVIPLALSENSALQRLESTRRTMSKLKNSPFYRFHYYSVKLIINRLPAYITRHAFHLFDTTCYITNVPLQQSRCVNVYGEEVLGYNVFPPHDGNVGLGFVISSFNGNMQLAVSADHTIAEIKDVDVIIESAIEEFEELENCMIKIK